MKTVLVTGDDYSPAHWHALAAAGIEVLHRGGNISSAELETLLPSIDGYLLGGVERLEAAELAKATRLKSISFVGTGYGAFIDAAAAARYGIEITNTPGVMAPAVVEHTIGLMLGMRRNLFALNEAIKKSASCSVGSEELAAASVGIVGMGAIGERLARVLHDGFGCNLLYYSRTRKPSLENELGIMYRELDDLFRASDMVVLLVPTSAETKGFVDERRLGLMKENAILINTAGATLVDPKALSRALLEGRLQSAAFDGYYIEPLPKVADDPFGLLSLPDGRFVVTPHSAAKTPESWRRMVDMAVGNIVDCFSREDKG
jgi:glyoxylate reductase